jgi:hypothetical protein
MKRAPYTFPHRTRKAMIGYLLEGPDGGGRRGYYEHWGGNYPFSWNVKAYHVDWGHPKGENELDASLDAKWEKHLEDDGGNVENWAFENARMQIDDDEWCSYPGDDQGDWDFAFAGRSGGHLVLQEWRGMKVHGESFDLVEWLDSLDTDTLRKFYRGIRTADSDFTSAKASEEVEYHVNFIRSEWELERQRELEDEARDIEQTRPDLYGDMGA